MIKRLILNWISRNLRIDVLKEEVYKEMRELQSKIYKIENKIGFLENKSHDTIHISNLGESK